MNRHACPTVTSLCTYPYNGIGDVMARCPFFRAEIIFVERRRAHRIHMSQTPAVSAPWCAHLYSPVSRFLATNVVGGANKLRCGGELEKCHIPPQRRPKTYYNPAQVPPNCGGNGFRCASPDEQLRHGNDGIPGWATDRARERRAIRPYTTNTLATQRRHRVRVARDAAQEARHRIYLTTDRRPLR